MATLVRMPKMGVNMEEGLLIRFLAEPGTAVKKGDPLFEIETDKTQVEAEAPEDGILLKILVDCDEYYDCGTVLAVLGELGEDISSFE